MESVRARNLLSFGSRGLDLELRDLNVIIGANSSGKSNLVGLFSLLQAAPTDITKPIGAGGGIQEWLWKGADAPAAELSVTLRREIEPIALRYTVAFRQGGQRFALVDEKIDGVGSGISYYHRLTEQAVRKQSVPPQAWEPHRSVLAQWRGPQYPEITWIANSLERIKIYQDWLFDRTAGVRHPQRTDLPSDFLWEDAGNLALVLDDLNFRGLSGTIEEHLNLVNPDFRKLKTRTAGGTIQVYLEEQGLNSPTPASRLSQGALQLLCLLVVLLHPDPPPLICLEEPEKGLHPDILPELAKLLVTASERTQLIVTTHSEILVDALSDTPEAVIVCEKEKGETSLRRLAKSDLTDWLDGYGSLGKLWRTGAIGGNRW